MGLTAQLGRASIGLETHNSDTIIVDISFVMELLLDLCVFTSRPVILTSEMDNGNKSARSGGRVGRFR